MKRKSLSVCFMILAVSMFVMVSCSQSMLGCDVIDESHMVITSEKSNPDDSTFSGSIVVGDDQQIVIDSQLEEGGMQIEFIDATGMDDMEEIPEDVEAKYTANVSGVESQAVSFGAGEFVVRATVTEKATGTVDIQVKGFGE